MLQVEFCRAWPSRGIWVLVDSNLYVKEPAPAFAGGPFFVAEAASLVPNVVHGSVKLETECFS